MQSITVTASAIYRVVIDIQGRLPSHLERCLYQNPFILEDAHTRRKPIYMDCINSWDAFDAWLEVQFRGLPGHAMVQHKLYVLHDNSTNTDIDPFRPWEMAFLPGQRIVMCMLFLELFASSRCPRCSLESPVTESDIEW